MQRLAASYSHRKVRHVRGISVSLPLTIRNISLQNAWLAWLGYMYETYDLQGAQMVRVRQKVID